MGLVWLGGGKNGEMEEGIVCFAKVVERRLRMMHGSVSLVGRGKKWKRYRQRRSPLDLILTKGFDDTSQSQNLDIEDAPASIQEQKTDKKTPRMVILQVSMATVLQNIVEEAKKRRGMVFVSIGALVFFGILCGYHFLAFEFFKTVEVSAKDMLPGGVTADSHEWSNKREQEQWDSYIDSLSEEEMLIFVGIMLSRLGSTDNQLAALEVRKDLEAEGDIQRLTLLAYGYVTDNFIEKWNECIYWLKRYKLWGWKASYIGTVNELRGLEDGSNHVLGARYGLTCWKCYRHLVMMR